MDETSRFDDGFDAISFTARKILQKRALHTNIPYAKAMAEAAGVEWRVSGVRAMLRNLVWGKLRSGLFLQLRYNAISEALKQHPDCCVVEIACGYTTRGIVEAPQREAYIETDLVNLLSQKRRLVEKILDEEPPANHHFHPLNICSEDEMHELGHFIASLTLQKPLVVIHEGLLMYLDDEEKQMARDNIRWLLQKHSPAGAWITTDFSERDLDATLLQRLMTFKLTKRVDREFQYFRDDEQVESFLQAGGFNIEKLPNLEADNPNRPMREMAETFRAHRMTLAD